jgi:thiol-disulfide isomerase/thioredoxin
LVKLAFADYHILYQILTKNTTMFLELTEDKLQEIINSNAKVMVQYGASWCGNCRIMKPKFKNCRK